MNSTAITLSPDMNSRLALGHDIYFDRTPNWDLPTLAGAGALRSTANDMLSFLAAQLGYKPSGLDAAIARTYSPRRDAGPDMEIGLGWLIRSTKDSEIIWHNGGTGGYRSFAGFDPKAKIGVVVLTNGSTQAGPDDIGFHLLNQTLALLPHDSNQVQPWKKRKEITLDAGILDKYVGQYQLAPGAILTVTRKSNQLFVQLTGQSNGEIYPENETDFFSRLVDAQLLFKTDSRGRTNAVILRQFGRDQIAPRIGGDAILYRNGSVIA